MSLSERARIGVPTDTFHRGVTSDLSDKPSTRPIFCRSSNDLTPSLKLILSVEILLFATRPAPWDRTRNLHHVLPVALYLFELERSE